MTATTPDHEMFLRRAIALSREHALGGAGGPFGAIVVRNGIVVAEGWNVVTSTLDPTGHAEVTAIRRASIALGTFTLAGCTMYSSCEPCPMCFGAIHWARLDKTFYGATRDDAAAIGFDDALLYEALAAPPDTRMIGPLESMQAEARSAMDAWAAWPDRVRF